jgi:PAS domain S-box-containing protein
VPPSSQPPPAGGGPLHKDGDRLVAEIGAPIAGPAGTEDRQSAPKGAVLGIRSPLAVNPPGMISRLVGGDALVLIGNKDGALWANLETTRVVPGPSIDSARGGVAESASNGEQRIGAFVPIADRPWLIWVDFPKALVIAPARAFLRWMIAVALAFGLVSGLLVRRVTASLTTPMTDMTAAAEALAHGDYARRVDVSRDDEIGRLGHAFNMMAAEVESSYNLLESRVKERTRELNDAVAALNRHSHAREAYLASIVDNSADAIIGANLDTTIRSWNRGAERLYGYTAAEAIGRPGSMLVPRERAGEIDTIVDQIKSDASIRSYETERVRKDGSIVTVSVTMSPLRNAEGEIVGVSTVARDVTDVKTLEDQLRQAQKMEAIGRLAGGVAHDFNNLLTAILGYSLLLAESLDPASDDRELVDEIRKAGERAAALTNQLLAFSRRQVMQVTRIDLNALVDDMTQMLTRLIGEHIQLETVLAPNLAAVRADRTQMEQILLNLAVNARDAMPDGGRLVIETANVDLDEAYRLQHAVAQPGPYVMLAVSDTGVGMDEDTKRRLFEPFFTTKERGRGTGLGLATVYGIVKQSGGYIWVYSEPGHGTTFKVYVPRASETDESAPSVPASQAPGGGHETVLLVEDEAAVRHLVKTLLERGGYRVLDADTTDRAKAIFEERREEIDILVTDVIMPGSSGPALFRALSASRPALKVMYMSGYTDDAIVRGGHLDEGVAFLHKPFTAAGLLRKIREALD